MPGCESGDLGPKFGYQSKDNGFLRFNQYRIPRENLLSRFAEVLPSGEFKTKGDLRVLYSIMLYVRMQIIGYASRSLAQGLTIAARYSVVRRQFPIEQGSKEEQQLIEYQSHQFKIIPALADAYAFSFAGQRIQAYHI